jgi:protein-L-isoaspartate O-methyltransferase
MKRRTADRTTPSWFDKLTMKATEAPPSRRRTVISDAVDGTQGYAREAPDLHKRYESISFADVHGLELHLIPAGPCNVLEIGAGTGRDAAALAAMGHRVLAVEPTRELRTHAQALHPSSRIEWLDDSLPDLAVVLARDETFDLVMLTAVWMHLDAPQRRHAMPRLASLLAPAGTMIMSLRHGPVPPGRRMFAEETIQLAHAQDLSVVLNQPTPSVMPGKDDVTWTRLAFVKAGERR